MGENMRILRKLALLLSILLAVSALPIPALTKSSVQADTFVPGTVDPDSILGALETDDDDFETESVVDEEVWEEDASLGYQIMPDECVKKIQAAGASYLDSVDLSMYKIPFSTQEQKDIYWADLNLCRRNAPVLFYIDYTSTGYSNGYVSYVKFTYKYTKEEAAAMLGEIDAVANQALANLDSSMTTYEKLLVLHDWMANQTAYAYDRYLSGSYDEHDHDMYGVFVQKEAVCEGYAKAYMYLLQKLGIESYYARNTELNHAWNVVKIGNEYFNVDVTWDDPVEDILGRVIHKYFLVDNDTMYARSNASHRHLAPENFDADKLTSTRYANGIWATIDNPIVYHNGTWYYAAYSSRNSQLYKTTDILKSEGTVFYTFSDEQGIWKSSSSSWYSGVYSRLQKYAHYLIFNTNQSIEYFDLNALSSTPTTMYTVSQLSADPSAYTFIYGFTTKGRKLAYSVNSLPKGSTIEYIENKLAAEATNTPKPTNTNAPTVTKRPTNTNSPTPSNTPKPTNTNTPSPTKKPTVSPTKRPTVTPTKKPTVTPTKKATATPTPTKRPTSTPTKKPTATPTATKRPTSAPTKKPTSAPTKKPTSPPTKKPTAAPTKVPTVLPPYNVKATASSPTTVKINWTARPGTQFVQVWRTSKANAEQKDYVLLGTYNASDGQSNSKLLTPNKTYFYKLRGYTKLANGKKVYSGYSTIVSAKPSVTVNAPTGLTITAATSSSISLRWNRVSGSNIMYEVWRLTSSTNTPGVCLGRYTDPAKVSTNLKSGTTYYYRVRAYYYYYDANGELHRVYGQYCDMASGKTK